MTTTTYAVAGMTCGHCVASVTSEVRKLDTAADVTIDLVKGGQSTLTVTSQVQLDRAAVAAAVEEAGYLLVDAS